MSTDNNNIKFTAKDIERYHKGLLSSKEMHAIEKAAMDDPFLSDALDGYSVDKVNVMEDINDLKKRLTARLDETKVVSMYVGRRNFAPMLKIAVMIVVLLGAALLVYRFGFNKNNENIAKVDTVENKNQEVVSPSANDSGKNVVQGLLNQQANQFSPVETTKVSMGKASSKKYYNNDNEQLETISQGTVTRDSAITAIDKRALSIPAPGTTRKELADDKAIASNTPVKTEQYKEDSNFKIGETNGRNGAGYTMPANNATANNRENVSNMAKSKYDNQMMNRINKFNYFRGRITDADNNPIPFANITNTEDNVGTYSDAKGYFNMTSPDSILNVQVKSIGFDNSNIQLKNNIASNKVVLKEDHTLNEVVISNKKVNASGRSQNNNLKMEESEPADGWDNYDTYLANNLNTPEEVKEKKSGGEVEVTFDVDKNGDPINVKVVKSLCSECDKEAIRLIENGPKWKKKAKKGRTLVKVSF